MIYAFDPGDTTGVAIGDLEGNLKDYFQLNVKELYGFLEEIESADVFLVEDFHIMPGKAQSFSWSNMEVIQVIGALKYAAWTKHRCGVTMQRPTVKNSGYRWAGIMPPKNHNQSHATDAYAHLVYYWVNVLKLEAPVIKQMRLNNAEA